MLDMFAHDQPSHPHRQLPGLPGDDGARGRPSQARTLSRAAHFQMRDLRRGRHEAPRGAAGGRAERVAVTRI